MPGYGYGYGHGARRSGGAKGGPDIPFGAVVLTDALGTYLKAADGSLLIAPDAMTYFTNENGVVYTTQSGSPYAETSS